MGFPANDPLFVDTTVAEFQSLIGIYGFSGWDFLKPKVGCRVSIPNRDLWVFRRWQIHGQ